MPKKIDLTAPAVAELMRPFVDGVGAMVNSGCNYRLSPWPEIYPFLKPEHAIVSLDMSRRMLKDLPSRLRS
jgi:hypothetical protein